jgi:hypothetical protein
MRAHAGVVGSRTPCNCNLLTLISLATHFLFTSTVGRSSSDSMSFTASDSASPTMHDAGPSKPSLTARISDGGVISVQAQPFTRFDKDFVQKQICLPQFPYLQGQPGPLTAPTLVSAPPPQRPSKRLEDVQDIAKEALRLTKETLHRQNQPQPAGTM